MQVQSAQRLFDMPPDVCDLFEGGEPKATRVIELLKYKKRDVAQATNVPVNSVRYDAQMPNELRERLTEWATAINTVAGFFGNDVEKTMLWFQTPNPLLGGISPREMIRQGRFKKLFKFISTAISENAR